LSSTVASLSSTLLSFSPSSVLLSPLFASSSLLPEPDCLSFSLFEGVLVSSCLALFSVLFALLLSLLHPAKIMNNIKIATPAYICTFRVAIFINPFNHFNKNNQLLFLYGIFHFQPFLLKRSPYQTSQSMMEGTINPLTIQQLLKHMLVHLLRHYQRFYLYYNQSKLAFVRFVDLPYLDVKIKIIINKMYNRV